VLLHPALDQHVEALAGAGENPHARQSVVKQAVQFGAEGAVPGDPRAAATGDDQRKRRHGAKARRAPLA
jgi:hypothetical protein